jgi:phage repressor protein C with HTH and peptisase S24 domain
MIKKSSGKGSDTVHTASDFARGRKKSLEIKQIREHVDKLEALPDGAPMPDWSELSIGDRFGIVLRLVPADQRKRLLGKSDSHVKRYERGDVDVPFTVVAALAAETEIPLDWIVSGKAMERRLPLLMMVPGNHDNYTDDVPVQKLAFKMAAGRGALMLDDTAEHVRFPRAVLQHAGVTPPNARLMEAAGDSMKSTINDGDLMLVDVSPAAATIVDGKIYVFSLGDEGFVKRLRRSAGKVIMVSDNRDVFPPEEVPPESEMRVYGQVKWVGRNVS